MEKDFSEREPPAAFALNFLRDIVSGPPRLFHRSTAAGTASRGAVCIFFSVHFRVASRIRL